MMHTTLYSHSGQGIRAGLPRWGTVPSRVPVSINTFSQYFRRFCNEDAFTGAPCSARAHVV
eukprot:3648729-Prymnesium_polylepis.1